MRIALLIALLAGNLAGAIVCPPAHPYRQEYKRKTFGRKAMAGVAAGAGVKQATNSPHQWGRGAAGFGKRVASGFGTHIIKNSVEYTVAGVRHEDLRYYRSTRRGFGPRMRHALVSTVITHKTTNGRKTAASGRISGAVGSGLAASAWQPAGFSAAGGAATGGLLLAGDAGANVAREFWPRRRHPRRRRMLK